MHYGGKHYHQQLFNQYIHSEVKVKNYERMGTQRTEVWVRNHKKRGCTYRESSVGSFFGIYLIIWGRSQ